MTLIKIDKPYSREKIAEDFGVEFPLSEWVLAQLSGEEEYESNRYDIEKTDSEGIQWSVFLYMDEHSSRIIAIDDVASKNNSSRDWAHIERSPFARLFQALTEDKAGQQYTVGQHLYLKERQTFKAGTLDERVYERADNIVIWSVLDVPEKNTFLYTFYFAKDRPDRRCTPKSVHVLDQHQLNELFFT